MTLAIATAVRDGVIIAADSRSSFTDQANQLRISSDYTEKLYQVHNVAVATAGWNTLSARTIAAHVRDLTAQINEDAIDKVCDAFRDYFVAAYSQHKIDNPIVQPPPDRIAVEFLLTDYRDNKPEVRRLVLHEPSAQNPDGWAMRVVLDRGENGMAWIGTTDVVQRIFNGYSAPVPPGAIQDFLRASVPPIAYQLMALQDALNLGLFGIEATMRMQRFSTSRDTGQPENPNVGALLI